MALFRTREVWWCVHCAAEREVVYVLHDGVGYGPGRPPACPVCGVTMPREKGGSGEDITAWPELVVFDEVPHE